MMNHAVINGTSSSRQTETLACREMPTDALLPQLSVILDPEAMKNRLQEQVFESVQERERFRILSCEIDRVRYKPESSCMVTYRLEIEDRATRETGDQILCGRAYPDGRSQSQWEKARARAMVQPRFGKPVVYLPNLEMVLWSFPNDRKMDTLPILADSGHFTSAILPKVLASHLGEDWTLIGATRTLVHYVGEHTCTVRIDATVAHQDDHRRQTITLFEKTYYNGEGEETFQIMHQLWQSGARRSGQLVIAMPVWYDSSLKTLWQLGFKGTPFGSCDVYGSEFLPSFEEAARRLATLHVTPIACKRSTTVADLVADLKRVIPALIRLRPSCASTLRPLVNRLLAQAEQMPEEPRATLHGDLHLQNLFIGETHVALIDLDNVRTGSPLLDIGSLIAGLHYVRILQRTSPESCQRLVERFLQTYQANVPWAVLPSILNWYAAVALITERAYRCVTQIKPGRLNLIDDLVVLASQITCEAEQVNPAIEHHVFSNGGLHVG